MEVVFIASFGEMVCKKFYYPFNFMFIFRRLCGRYGINFYTTELPVALRKLYRRLRLEKKMEFQCIWNVVSKQEVMESQWRRHHWVLSPDLAHYAHDLPVMHWGYDEDHSEVKTEQYDPDLEEVW